MSAWFFLIWLFVAAVLEVLQLKNLFFTKYVNDSNDITFLHKIILRLQTLNLKCSQ